MKTTKTARERLVEIETFCHRQVNGNGILTAADIELRDRLRAEVGQSWDASLQWPSLQPRGWRPIPEGV